ncbi:MAG: universal stress protein [Desulfobulbaceae bacterium]|nr:universal stress protein [Desulfobulbaceae bacterium]
MLQDGKKILVPVDFSDNAQKVFGAAVNMARTFGVDLVCLYVVQSFYDDFDGFIMPQMPILQFHQEVRTAAEKRMAQFTSENAPQGLTCSSEILDGDIAEEIVAYATAEEVGLIVMGTHGFKGLDRALFGSVAAQVVKTAPCPVLTVNPWR